MVAADVIRAAIDEAWLQVAPPHATLEIRSLPILPGTATASVEVLLPEGIDRAGSRAIPVTCHEGARVVSRGLASVVIRVEREVWIAARALRRGELVDSTEFVCETRTFAREPRPLLRPQTTERYRVRRDVPRVNATRRPSASTIGSDPKAPCTRTASPPLMSVM